MILDFSRILFLLLTSIKTSIKSFIGLLAVILFKYYIDLVIIILSKIAKLKIELKFERVEIEF